MKFSAKKETFEKIIFRNYMVLILTAALLISLFSAGIDAATTYSHEKNAMMESLKQAQYNINNHSQMIEDYLTLTHSSQGIQRKLKSVLRTQSAATLTEINDQLFAVDLFKKNLDSMQIFAYDENGFLPRFSPHDQYNNALFSAESVEDQNWFSQTLAAGGSTYWYVDETNFRYPTLCAARLLYDVNNMNRVLGVLRANVTVEKFIRHLASLSFGDRGYAMISAGDKLLHNESILPKALENLLPHNEQRLSRTHLLVKFPVITENWHMMGVISYWSLYKNTAQNLLWISLVSLGTILLAAFLSRKNSRRISSPIHRLCRQMGRMEAVPEEENTNCIEIAQLYETYNGMLKKNETLIKAREEALLKFKQAEMAALQSQMNPHFIYNTLESISALIAIGETKNASLMTKELGNFLRSSLNNGNNYITLEKEIAQVTSYIQIQKLRYSNRLSLRLNLPDPLPECRIIKLILQPLVENCIHHGFKDFTDVGEITITVEETPEDLLLSVADNGWGSDIEMLNYLVKQRTLYREDNVDFYCIQNVYQRLQNCYGEHASLTYYENKDGGVTARIQIAKQVL